MLLTYSSRINEIWLRNNKGRPDNDHNAAGYPSTTGNPSGGGRGNDNPKK